MTLGYRATADRANSADASPCRKSEGGLPLISAVMRAARSLWPSKTALELSARTGASERMCRYWLAEQFDISADHLAGLLRSDAGLEILEHIMADAKPVWWQRFRRQASISAARRDIEAARKRLEKLEATE